jgi:hypothetical protein
MGWFSTEAEKRAKRQTQLNRMLFKDNIDKVRAALDAGADPNAIHHKENKSALYFHANEGNADIMRLLLERKADVNLGKDSWTPLIIAARQSNPDCALMLIDAGADLNRQVKNNGWTAMHWAAYWGRGNVISALMEKGADLTLTDHQMNTAADIADREKYPRLGDMIRGTPRAEEISQQVAGNGWQLTASHEIALVTEKKQIGYKLTEIFNFKTAMYTQIAANMASGAESQSMRSFDEFSDTQILREALTELTRKGGLVSEDIMSKFSPKPGLAAKSMQGGG